MEGRNRKSQPTEGGRPINSRYRQCGKGWLCVDPRKKLPQKLEEFEPCPFCQAGPEWMLVWRKTRDGGSVDCVVISAPLSDASDSDKEMQELRETLV